MSNWYVPPCPGNEIQFHKLSARSLEIQESTIQSTNNKMGRKLVIKSEMQIDRTFFLDRPALWNCTQNPPANLQSYCQDAQSTLIPALDRVGKENDDRAPVFLQFGDAKRSGGDGYINLPLIKKIRCAATKASLANVTNKQCYNGPRDPLITKLENENLQPIVWKLRTQHHYSMLPDVATNDTKWSLKIDKAVFRGSLSGYHGNCMSSKRCRLVFQHGNSTLVDARLSRTLGRLPNTLDGVKLTGQGLTMEQQLKYKAILVVEGNDVATGLKWALLSNSVVMMQPPSHTSWAMEELLEPWVHYIPLNEDFSDVEEKMQWILDNDEQAQLIAQRGSSWIYDLVLHPEAPNNDKQIQDEIIRRYRAHFVAADSPLANNGSSSKKHLSETLITNK
jgi:hypothetical protein